MTQVNKSNKKMKGSKGGSDHFKNKKHVSDHPKEETVSNDDSEQQSTSNTSVTFEDLNVLPEIISSLKEAGIKYPSPIQVKTIPLALDGKDVLGAAQTGSGKTLAFGIPLLMSILEKKQMGMTGLMGLILTPTRELAIQIKKHLDVAAANIDVTIGCLVGGLAIPKQERILRKFKPDILVATPGRLWELIDAESQDHLTKNAILNLPHLVIDEADRMTEKGHFDEFLRVMEVLKEYENDEDSDAEDDCDEDGEDNNDNEQTQEEGVSDTSLDDKQIDDQEMDDVEQDEWQSLDEEEEEVVNSDDEEGIVCTQNRTEMKEILVEGIGLDYDDDDVEDLDGDLDTFMQEYDQQEKRKQSIPIERQTLVFSATLTFVHQTGHRTMKFDKKTKRIKETKQQDNDEKMTNLMNLLGVDPDRVDIVDLTNKGIGKVDEHRLVESCVTCPKEEKDNYLYYFLLEYTGRTIVFCNSIDCVRRLSSLLKILKMNPITFHSEMDQKRRMCSLEKFTSIEGQGLLVASDVAARGLDISDVDHVIHYQVPRTTETYVHRSGRTARANKRGVSLLMVEPKEAINYTKLCTALFDGNHFPFLPIRESSFHDLKPIVKLARDIDVTSHRMNKVKVKSDWFRKMAKEADLDIDGRDDLFNDEPDQESLARDKKILQSKWKTMDQLLKGTGYHDVQLPKGKMVISAEMSRKLDQIGSKKPSKSAFDIITLDKSSKRTVPCKVEDIGPTIGKRRKINEKRKKR